MEQSQMAGQLASMWAEVPWLPIIRPEDVETGGDERKRLVEVGEILCATLWRLQIWNALGPIVNSEMENRKKHIAVQTSRVAWQRWGQAEPTVEVNATPSGLFISMNFERGTPLEGAYLLQTSVMADTALRITGVSDVLNGVCTPPTFLNRGHIKSTIARLDDAGLKAWLQTDKSNVRAGAILHAMRDAYMHAVASPGTSPPPGSGAASGRSRSTTTSRSGSGRARTATTRNPADDPLRRLRQHLWTVCSTQDVFDACITAWKAVSTVVKKHLEDNAARLA